MPGSAMNDAHRYPRTDVLGASIHALSWDEALERVEAWADARESRYVCLCNVHSVVTASRDAAFRRVINAADLAAPDGMPVAWSLRWLGFRGQPRIGGPDLMWRYCARAEANGQAIFLFGATEPTLGRLQTALRRSFPRLRLAGAISPPFRDMSAQETDEVIERLNASGANVIFIGLGCPKQEFWMAQHRARIRAVLVGVGAAFDYHAGTLPRAPLWMQQIGLEWLYRLAKEPRRLWRRYLSSNSAFIIGIVWQLLSRRTRNQSRPQL
jgi:N-acetylglucosaminyldiphosphoundecaprenol N-acetyl-beta-D-mannosaminyltransferase